MNGAFLRAGILREQPGHSPLSMAHETRAAGLDSGNSQAAATAPLCAMTLASSEMLEGRAVWLRYAFTAGEVGAPSSAVSAKAASSAISNCICAHGDARVGSAAGVHR